MKSLSYIITALVLSLSSVVFASPEHPEYLKTDIDVEAAPVGDTVDYTYVAGSTMIRGGSGSAVVLQKKTSSYQYGAGYVLRINFDMTVLIRGKQEGYIDVFVPLTMFDEIHALKEEKNYGAYKLQKIGDVMVEGRRCSHIKAMNIDHHFKPQTRDGSKAVVLAVVNSGSLQAVTDIVIDFKSTPDVKVLGAMEISVSGKSTLSFNATFKKK